MKKLSTTFRRKTNVSPTNIITAAQTNHRSHNISGPVLHQPRLSSEASPKAGRSITFSAGSPVDLQPQPPLLSEPEIPFFGDRDRDSELSERPKSTNSKPTKNNNNNNNNNPGNHVAVVRGKPAWLRDSDDQSTSKPPIHPRQLSHQPRATTRVLKETNNPQPEYNRTRHYSFDMDRTSAQQKTNAGAPPTGRRRRPSRRRWLVPLQESSQDPHLFTPPVGSEFERIGKHRDRAEAKVLVSACTYLEAELTRIKEQVEINEGCCCKDPTKCDCAHVSFLRSTSERLQSIMCILEDRYDTIEQVYVKSEEYARAMGNFFQVTPDEFSRMIHQKDANSTGKKSHKSLR